MEDKKNKSDLLDEFWDISSLIPPKKQYYSTSKSIKTSEISVGNTPFKNEASQSDSIIKRYIDPLYFENKKIRREAFVEREEYEPQSVLIHKVILKKRKSEYDLYGSFLNTALKFMDTDADEVPYVSYYSYVPQYDQLSKEQFAYYLWWRKCFNEGTLIKTDQSYVLLYVYELINIGSAVDARLIQGKLARLWNEYHKEFSAICGKLAVWICDFSLLHRLDPPLEISRSITKHTPSLKEFFIHIPEGDYTACVRSLLKYGTEYDYHTSKFATERNIDVFDRHVFGAMLAAVKFFSKDGRLLSSLSAEDSKLIRNAFDGALCASKWRYEIEVRYCSFSHSNEIRFIMGDIVKYAENKIRAFLGIKSKLSVYSIGIELQRALDEYFEGAFAKEKPVVKKVVAEKQDYDALYDIPARPLSLENARKIENSSWSTTHDLISAFERDEVRPDPIVKAPEPVEESQDGDLRQRLGKYYDFVVALKNEDNLAMNKISKALESLPEAIVDKINEIAVDTIGDILVEDNGDGFCIVDCYLDMI